MTGYRADDVIGQTPGLLQGSGTDREVLERLEDDLANNRTFHGRAINYRKNGDAFEMEWTVRKVVDLDHAQYYLAVQREAA